MSAAKAFEKLLSTRLEPWFEERGFARRKRREDDLGIADLGSDDERIRRRVQVRLRRA